MNRLALAVVVASLCGAVAAETSGPAAPLFMASSIRCELDRGTQASWDDGSLKLENVHFGKSRALTFDSIDANAGKARLIGNVGAGDVTVLVTNTGLTFIETTLSGNLNFTTVFAAPYAPDPHLFVAVQSQHVDIAGPFPAQYHGTCRVLEERGLTRQ